MPILYLCAREACECFDTSEASEHDACPNKQLPLPVAGMSAHVVDDCHLNAVVGGLRIVQALVEEDGMAHNVGVLSLLASTCVSPAPNNMSSWFTYSHSESVSLPSGEKYVLNATLVI